MPESIRSLAPGASGHFSWTRTADPGTLIGMSHAWSPEDYRRNAAFVPALGTPVLERLKPQAGERVLDVGCGDGSLTAAIAAAGASVVGIDSSAAMVADAVGRGIDARVVDARALPFEEEFDAAFSNAALHWVQAADQPAVLQGVFRALRPGGRFAAELGGHTNIAGIAVALRAVLRARAIEHRWPWYFPSPAEYRALLEAAGFHVEDLRLFPRPTPLPTDMEGWLRTFAVPILAPLPASLQSAVITVVLELLRPSLCDSDGNWTADYVRLQAFATKPRASR
jgi:trans-aconitate methyltransferase